MRTLEQINSIKATISDPYAIEDFLSVDDVDYLVKLFDSQEIESNKVYKNTGPITLDIKPYLGDPVVAKIIDKLVKELGPFEMTAGFFFTTNYPHIIHNDDTFELPAGVYKGITIPLKVYGSERIPKLCFFDQFYFHGPAKFFYGEEDIPTYYNKQVYNYQDVDGISDAMLVDESTRVSYLSHLKPKWLTGLTLWGTLDWRPTSVLIFDSTRLHCASDFRQQGITHKLGISIFTKIVKDKNV
jgi:hypothetical protein